MNIFILDTDPKICASYHCDKHVVKMIVETAQILSTALHLNGLENPPYKPTHKNHPCVQWAASSSSNFNWLLQLGFWLSTEYITRYGKTHKSEEVILKCSELRHIITPKLQTPFTLCCPEEYKSSDPVETYRRYYKAEKSIFAKYKNSTTPKFMQP